jgi:hypothetical protein
VGLNLARGAALGAILALAAVWAVQQSEANFGVVQGASGIAGVTCASCHQPPHPTRDDAAVRIDGLPAAWTPGATYPLTLSVAGGPDPLPPPAPQGGFDIATDGGTLAPAPGNDALMLLVSPREASYTPEGSLRRSWQLVWTAPGLETRPARVTFWLAGLAANGNHVVALGAADGGETLDAAAATVAHADPAPEADAAWRAMPLVPPVANATAATDGWRVDGHHADANATHLLWRTDGGPWQLRQTGREWRLLLPPGAHHLEYRSDGADRRSPVQDLEVGGGDAPASAGPPTRAAPALALASAAAALALASIARRRP